MAGVLSLVAPLAAPAQRAFDCCPAAGMGPGHQLQGLAWHYLALLESEKACRGPAAGVPVSQPLTLIDEGQTCQQMPVLLRVRTPGRSPVIC